MIFKNDMILFFGIVFLEINLGLDVLNKPMYLASSNTAGNY